MTQTPAPSVSHPGAAEYRPYAPWPVRWGNAVAGRLLRRNKPSLRPADLMAAAERAAGTDDWGEAGYRDFIAAQHEALEEEGNLTPFGRLSFRQLIVQHMTNRLLIRRALADFPDIRQVEVEQPILIVGWYRTGSTLLHNLLGTLPYFRLPLLWELRTPCLRGDPRRSPAGAIRVARLQRAIHRYLAPNFDTIHPMAADLPDECLHLFENSGVSTNTFFVSGAHRFAWWLLEQDMRPAYRFFRQQLQLLAWLRPGGRWALKWPYHFWHLDALIEAIPDARILYITRDPVKVLPSVCSLAVAAKSPMCRSIDRHALGRFWLDYMRLGRERGEEQLAKLPPEQRYRLELGELVQDPAGEVERILEHFGIEPAAEDAERVLDYMRANPANKHGVHRYRLQDFGLDGGEVRARLSS